MQRSIRLAKEAEADTESALGLIDADVLPWQKPVVMLDGLDAPLNVSTEQIDYPDLLIPDLGTERPRAKRYSAGFLAFAPTAGGRKLLKYWANECAEDKMNHLKLREQWYLYRAIEQCRPLIAKLDPDIYNWVPPNPKADPAKCIVMHTRNEEWTSRCPGVKPIEPKKPESVKISDIKIEMLQEELLKLDQDPVGPLPELPDPKDQPRYYKEIKRGNRMIGWLTGHSRIDHPDGKVEHK